MSRSTLVLLSLTCLSVMCISLVSGDCGIGGIDLSSLANSDLTYTDEKNQEWLVRPCGPTANTECLQAGAQTSSCMQASAGVEAYGFWTQSLWHKWSFLDPNNPTGGIQLYMEGSPAPQGCNQEGNYYTWLKFPCSQSGGNFTVVQGGDCSVNMTLPTKLTCRPPLETKILLSEE